MFTKLLVLTVLLFLSGRWQEVFGKTDLTLEDGSAGYEVVEATLRKIRRSGIFQDDFEFFDRLAYVESEDGEGTLRANDGGIWQVDDQYLALSKKSSLADVHAKISQAFNISWTGVNALDLHKPLYSALAARLYLLLVGEEIPQSVAAQSEFWLRNYNQRDATKDTFASRVEEMENKTVECQSKIDFVVVLDGSGSVGAVDFLKSKEFVASLVENLSLISSRFGYMVFESYVDTLLQLDNGLTIEQIKRIILNYQYNGGGTDTNAAIKAAVGIFNAASERPGVPKVMAIITDGGSGTGVANIELARQAGISTFALGVGSSTNEEELLLIALNNTDHMFSLNDFDVLKDFYRRLNAETCLINQNPGFGLVTQDQLKRNQKRFYEYVLQSPGISIEIIPEDGEVVAFYSLEDPNPSAAFNEDVLIGNGTSFISWNGTDTYVYVTVQGLEENNVYTIAGNN